MTTLAITPRRAMLNRVPEVTVYFWIRIERAAQTSESQRVLEDDLVG